MSTLSNAELIGRYWTLVRMEVLIPLDAHTRRTWLERAEQKKRDSAIDLELSAVMMEFEERGLTEKAVAS